MEILIIGAGIGGLSAALSLALSSPSKPHKITILERSPILAEIGAGVQLTPVATQSFKKWGLMPSILSHSILPSTFNIRRDIDDTRLATVQLHEFERKHGAPYLVIHRCDIHRILHDACVKAGVEIKLASKVVEYDFEGGSVKLESGEVIKSDLVVGCDGINSFARTQFLGPTCKDTGKNWEGPTGWAAYRLIAPVTTLAANPLTAHLSADPNCHCWSGSKRSIMTYLVKGATKLNIVLSHPDDVDTSKWTSEQYKAEIMRTFGDVSPTVQALLAATDPEVNNWPVHQVSNLPKWKSESGKFILMGDAAHGMAFYLSMGVSLAVEDAEALTECVSRISNATSAEATNGNVGGEGLEHAMSVFETVRKRRAEAMRDASLHAGNMLHVPPGDMRDIRDRRMAVDGDADGKGLERFWAGKMAYGIADEEIREWCYGYDVQKEVEKAW